jgi:tRNA 2-thiouridine synthesizing protein A
VSELPKPDLMVDASGKFCPVPIMEVAKVARQANPGQVIELIATDPGVESDLSAWCKATRNEYLTIAREGSKLRAFVRKR